MANAIRVIGGGGGGASVLDLGLTVTPGQSGYSAVFASEPDFDAMKAATAVKVIIDLSAMQPGMVAEEILAVKVAIDMAAGAAGQINVGDAAAAQDVPMGFEFEFQNGSLRALKSNSTEIPFTIAGDNGGNSGDIS